MIAHRTLCPTVITIYQRSRILKLLWHRLFSNLSIKVAKLYLHVDHTPITNGTFIRRFQVIIITFMMDTVTTFHEYNFPLRSKHVITANRAIAVYRPLNAAMGILE
jgi:hypothetical protein